MEDDARACQLRAFPALEEPWSWYVKRRLAYLFHRSRALLRAAKAPSPNGGALPKPTAPPMDLAVGDVVRVRTKDEIARTLDENGACRGCPFSPAMYAFCGRELRVARVVHRFFDERRWRMLRTHDLVLLEGAHCDGSGLADTRGCDRMCFYFWRTEWLERVTPASARER